MAALFRASGNAARRRRAATEVFGIIYVIDVAGGDNVPRKGGPGITQSDLLVINKTDLAPHVGADLAVMDRDAKKMRGEGPTVFAQVKHGGGVDQIIALILAAWGQTQVATA